MLALYGTQNAMSLIVLLSVRAGLRAKEIAELKWDMLTDADGEIAYSIRLTDIASKGRSGRILPINMQLRLKLQDWLQDASKQRGFDIASSHVITTERSARTAGASNREHVRSMVCRCRLDWLLITFWTANIYHERCKKDQQRWWIA